MATLDFKKKLYGLGSMQAMSLSQGRIGSHWIKRILLEVSGGRDPCDGQVVTLQLAEVHVVHAGAACSFSTCKTPPHVWNGKTFLCDGNELD